MTQGYGHHTCSCSKEYGTVHTVYARSHTPNQHTESARSPHKSIYFLFRCRRARPEPEARSNCHPVAVQWRLPSARPLLWEISTTAYTQRIAHQNLALPPAKTWPSASCLRSMSRRQTRRSLQGRQRTRTSPSQQGNRFPLAFGTSPRQFLAHRHASQLKTTSAPQDLVPTHRERTHLTIGI